MNTNLQIFLEARPYVTQDPDFHLSEVALLQFRIYESFSKLPINLGKQKTRKTTCTKERKYHTLKIFKSRKFNPIIQNIKQRLRRNYKISNFFSSSFPYNFSANKQTQMQEKKIPTQSINSSNSYLWRRLQELPSRSKSRNQKRWGTYPSQYVKQISGRSTL